MSDQLFLTGFGVVIFWRRAKGYFKRGRHKYQEGGQTTLLTMVTERFCQDQLEKISLLDSVYLGLVKVSHYQEIWDIMITRYKTKHIFHLFQEMHWAVILKY